MGCHGTSTKSVLLRAYKDGVKKLRGDTDGSLSYHGLSTEVNPSRAFGRMYSVLVDTDLRTAWQHGKQRAKQQWREAYAAMAGSADCGAATDSSTHGTSVAASNSTDSNLQALYGSDGFFRTSLMFVLAHASKAFMQGLNATAVEGGHHLQAALQRPPGQALITVCNHVASMDDPLVMSTVIPTEYFGQASRLRWTLCATDRCFHSSLLSPFFRQAKVLPVERGAGMFQPGLAAAEARLAAGDWVHIFPEGTRSKDGRMGPVRKGVGRLVAACGTPPLIVPFVHSGMEEVMPRGRLVPRVGREVQVLVGEPVDVSDLFAAQQLQHWSDDTLYCRIADRVGSHLQVLKAQLDGVELDAAALDLRRQAQATAEQLDLYDPVDNIGRLKLWERLKFKMQHRKWTTEGWSASAATQVLAAARESSSEQLAHWADALPAWAAQQAQHAQHEVLAALALPGVAEEGGSGSSSSRAGDPSGTYPSAAALWAAAGRRDKYQQNVAMMQLLQARV